MKILLTVILILNSYVAVGGEYAAIDSLIKETPADCADQLRNRRGPAAAPECQTPKQLMSLNLNNREFTRICRNIVAQDEGCKKLKPEKRMSCNAKRENEMLSSADLKSKAVQCAKGFVVDSMYELGKFILDMIKMLVGAHINSYRAMYRFFTDPEYRQSALSSARGGSRMGMAFLNQAGLYFTREFTRNLARNPLNPLAAVGQTLLEPLMKFISESVQAIIAEYVPQYQCMNGVAKLYTMCRVAGEFFMPPIFIFTMLKGGITALRGLRTGANAVKISRVQRRFAEANELSEAAVRASRAQSPRQAPSRITVDNSPRSPAQDRSRAARAARQARPAPAVVPSARPRPAAPLTKPIEEHNADELIDIARSEQAETAALNRAEAARIEAQNLMNTDEYKNVLLTLTGPEKDEAIEALGQLSKTGVSPSIVVDMFRNYSPKFRAEIARSPAGAENLWLKLGRVVQKEKRAGQSDTAIKQKLDDAFKCE